MVALDQLLAGGRELAEAGVRGRYAPSPTGPLHMGNLRTALLSWLQVRLQGGTFVLRIEDIDQPRTQPGSADAILDDLDWLGLDWDEGPDIGGPAGPYTQSERDDIYQTVFAHFVRAGWVFPCFCSRRDIAEASSAPHGQSPVYPGTCRELSADGRAEMQAKRDGRHPAFRFNVSDRPDGWNIQFHDQICGDCSQNLAQDVGDFVVLRRDDLFAYQFVVVVDDALMGVTDVLRGEDLLDSTARQIRLFESMGAMVPRFWHVPLMRDAQGERLSKRDGSESLIDRRATGVKPETILGELAFSLGWQSDAKPISAADLLAQTTLNDIRGLR